MILCAQSKSPLSSAFSSNSYRGNMFKPPPNLLLDNWTLGGWCLLYSYCPLFWFVFKISLHLFVVLSTSKTLELETNVSFSVFVFSVCHYPLRTFLSLGHPPQHLIHFKWECLKNGHCSSLTDGWVWGNVAKINWDSILDATRQQGIKDKVIASKLPGRKRCCHWLQQVTYCVNKLDLH